MSDFNVMLREQARTGLQAQLNTAVTNGDTEAALKITSDLEKLAVSTAPKAPPFNDADIRAELDKQPWFGTDPKKSAKVVEFGKTLDPKKFVTAAAFAEALVKAVDEEFKPTGRVTAKEGEDETDGDNEDETDGDNEDETDGKGKTKPKQRATDAPGEADTLGRARRTSGPWKKLADAPAEVVKEINRSADKFVSSNAPKEQRDKFIAKALEAQYAVYQRTKGKK